MPYSCAVLLVLVQGLKLVFLPLTTFQNSPSLLFLLFPGFIIVLSEEKQRKMVCAFCPVVSCFFFSMLSFLLCSIRLIKNFFNLLPSLTWGLDIPCLLLSLSTRLNKVTFPPNDTGFLECFHFSHSCPFPSIIIQQFSSFFLTFSNLSLLFFMTCSYLYLPHLLFLAHPCFFIPFSFFLCAISLFQWSVPLGVE